MKKYKNTGRAREEKTLRVLAAIKDGKFSCDENGNVFCHWIINRHTKARIALKKPRTMAKRVMSGYEYVTLHLDGEYVLIAVHRVMCLFFFGYFPEALVPNHKDSDRKNNRLSNLELVSSSENTKHAYRSGTLNQEGAKNNSAKLTEDDVRRIRERFNNGHDRGEIAKAHGISRAAVYYVCKNGWRHV